MSPELRLILLGGFTVTLDNQPVIGLTSHKAQALLCYLAVTGRTFSRPFLAGLLWPDIPEANARMNLRKELARLNEVLRPYLLINRESVALDPDANYRLDVKEFEALLDAPPHLPPSIATLTAAVALYQGDFLEGFYVLNGPTLEEWALRQRSRLRERFLHALQSLAAAYTQQDDRNRATTTLQQLIALEPWREEAHCQLMRLYAQGGQRGLALAQYESCRRILRSELDVEPAPETAALLAAIQRGELTQAAMQRGAFATVVEPSPATDQADGAKAGAILLAPPPFLTLTHCRQNGRDGKETYNLKSTEHSDICGNLSVQTTTLLGREQELTTLVSRFAGRQTRLQTLTGAPGVGKTRLALEALSQLQPSFADGAAFIALAAIRNPDQLAQAIIDGLQIKESGAEQPMQHLIRYLQNKKILLVLDNFEQLLVGAGNDPSHNNEQSVTSLLTELLSKCPTLYLLVTSRERLHLRTEYRQRVPPLALTAAVELFVERAQTVQPALQLTPQTKPVIETLCRHLDCLPLAIELIAVQSELFSLRQLLDRLKKRGLDLLSDGSHDLPTRHRTLRSAIESSYKLLDEPQQSLFRALSVFVGSFDSEAVEAFGFAEETLQSLVNKSLVSIAPGEFEQPRYLLLETLRQFAAELLHQSDEGRAIQSCHAQYFVTIAENFGPYEPTVKARYWFNRLLRDLENVRTALAWAIEQGEVELALRFLWPLRCFWGNWRDEDHTLRDWARQTIALADQQWPQYTNCTKDKIDNVTRKKIDLLARAWYTVANITNDPQEWKYSTQRCLALNQLLDPNDITTSLYHLLGEMENQQGDLERADEIYRECLQFAQSLQTVPEHIRKNQIAWTIRLQGSLAFRRGQLQQAQHFFEQSIPLFKAIGQTFEENGTYSELHMTALYLNDFDQAERYYQLYVQGLDKNMHLYRDRLVRPQILRAIRCQQWQTAATLLVDEFQTHSLDELPMLYPEGFLWRVAQIAAHIGQHEFAAVLFCSIANFFRQAEFQLDRIYQPEYEAAYDLARRHLDQATFAAASARGVAMNMAELLSFIKINFELPDTGIGCHPQCLKGG